MTRERRDSLGRLRTPEQDATTFQPLDPSSPTTRLELRVPASLVKRVDSARGNVSRSEFVRAAIDRALDTIA